MAERDRVVHKKKPDLITNRVYWGAVLELTVLFAFLICFLFYPDVLEKPRWPAALALVGIVLSRILDLLPKSALAILIEHRALPSLEHAPASEVAAETTAAVARLDKLQGELSERRMHDEERAERGREQTLAPSSPLPKQQEQQRMQGDPGELLREEINVLNERLMIHMENQSRSVRLVRPPEPTEYRVWFATDRRPRVAGDWGEGFTAEYDDRLNWGSAVVHVPRSHAIGSLGSPLYLRIVNRIRRRPADEPLKIKLLEDGVRESVLADLSNVLSSMPKGSRELLLFIHGFNVTFEASALKAAQIGCDLNLPGPLIFFSWPSQGRVPAYGADAATTGRSAPLFWEFIQALFAIPGLEALNVIAHSMGNRILQAGLHDLNVGRKPTEVSQLGHIVLAAPDMDRATFRRNAQDYEPLRVDDKRRTTLYWNKSDRPLWFSKQIYIQPRLGIDGRGLSVMDSILWQNPCFRIDWLGHGYFAEARPILADMRSLLLSHAPPSKRANLKPVPSDVPQYWELVAPEHAER